LLGRGSGTDGEIQNFPRKGFHDKFNHIANRNYARRPMLIVDYRNVPEATN
jgi:hypothetical protein